MKAVRFVFTGVFVVFYTSAQPAYSRCPEGFTGEAGYNYCVPTDLSDRMIWLECSKEQRQLGLTEVSPCISEARRITLIDNYIYYCRKAKLPHLMH